MGKTSTPGLTDMQAAFVANYLVTLNAKKSATLAGYSEKSAEWQGYQLLQHPLVARELRKRMKARAKRLEINADNVLRELAKIAFSDIRQVIAFGPDGVTVANSEDMPDDAAAALQSIAEQKTVRRDPRGMEETITSTIKVKLYDKLRALELAGRHLGLWALPEPGGTDGDRTIKLAYAPKTKEGG